MDFNIKKPSHIIALLLIIITLFIIVINPIISFFNDFPSNETIEYQDLTESTKIMVEIFVLFTQLAIVIVLLVIFPFLWYIIVNKSSFKKILSKIKLRLKGLDTAFLWGILTVIVMFAAFFLVQIILTNLGVQSEEQGNIEDLETYFSTVSMFILLTIQPTAEEIFFRGFLLDKISSYGGNYFGIVITGVLFGLAHMSYGKIYPVIFITIMGFVLAYIVIKTKNLYTAIIAHTAFNLISFILYLFAKSLS